MAHTKIFVLQFQRKGSLACPGHSLAATSYAARILTVTFAGFMGPMFITSIVNSSERSASCPSGKRKLGFRKHFRNLYSGRLSGLCSVNHSIAETVGKYDLGEPQLIS